MSEDTLNQSNNHNPEFDENEQSNYDQSNENTSNNNSSNNNPHQSNQSGPGPHLKSDDRFKLFIAGLDWGTTSDVLYNYFIKFGPITRHSVVTDKETGRSRGFGFIHFGTEAAMNKCLEEQRNSPFLLDGRTIQAKEALPKEQTGNAPVRLYNKLFVSGLNEDIRDEDFMEAFSPFGPISSVEIIKDKSTQRTKGFGFVTFVSRESADKVLAAPEKVNIPGQTQEKIDIKPAVPKVDKSAMRNRGGGGRDGDRGGDRGGGGGDYYDDGGRGGGRRDRDRGGRDRDFRDRDRDRDYRGGGGGGGDYRDRGYNNNFGGGGGGGGGRRRGDYQFDERRGPAYDNFSPNRNYSNNQYNNYGPPQGPGGHGPGMGMGPMNGPPGQGGQGSMMGPGGFNHGPQGPGPQGPGPYGPGPGPNNGPYQPPYNSYQNNNMPYQAEDRFYNRRERSPMRGGGYGSGPGRRDRSRSPMRGPGGPGGPGGGGMMNPSMGGVPLNSLTSLLQNSMPRAPPAGPGPGPANPYNNNYSGGPGPGPMMGPGPGPINNNFAPGPGAGVGPVNPNAYAPGPQGVGPGPLPGPGPQGPGPYDPRLRY